MYEKYRNARTDIIENGVKSADMFLLLFSTLFRAHLEKVREGIKNDGRQRKNRLVIKSCSN